MERSAAKIKAQELLKKMTLEEKVGQMCLYGINETENLGVKSSERNELERKIAAGETGVLIQPCCDITEIAMELQRIAVEESRLKIPLLFNCDVIHGFETVFPVPIAAACSFNPELVKQTAEAAAEEAGSVGINYTNSPMVDISKDARWGRIAESQGEDPYLAGEMAKAYVEGFQSGEYGIISTLKHYAGYGRCEGGRDYGTSDVCENTMLNEYLVPFREGVAAGAGSVMSAFSVIENVPATGNKKYLRDILRGRFGFEGIVISDAMSVVEMMAHGYCETKADCARRAVEAGVDVELAADCYPKLIELCRNGEVSEELIDEAVVRILTAKFMLGLFENPYKFFRDKSVIFSNKHLELAEKIAAESAVLLENNGTLPLEKGAKIAVIGDYSLSHDLLGCWQGSSKKEEVVPIAEALKQFYSVVGVTENYNINQVEFASADADVVVFTFGEHGYENGEAASKHNLQVRQEVKDCFHYLKSRGKKVVTLVFSGRPLIINDFKYSDALMYCWNLGHGTGNAVAKLMCGEYVPSGKLSVTFPRDERQIPIYYNCLSTGRPYLKNRQDYPFQVRYADGNNYPQYPFGYGLSYAKFSCGNVCLSDKYLHKGGSLTVSAEIFNNGEYDGTETVQLYINDCVADTVRPIKELKGFKKVFVKANERVRVDFEITEDMLKYYGLNGEFKADSGKFKVFIGADSTVEDYLEFTYLDK